MIETYSKTITFPITPSKLKGEITCILKGLMGSRVLEFQVEERQYSNNVERSTLSLTFNIQHERGNK